MGKQVRRQACIPDSLVGVLQARGLAFPAELLLLDPGFWSSHTH